MKKKLKIYIGIMLTSPMMLLFFDFMQMQIRKTKFRQEHGYIQEEYFIDGVGAMFIFAGLLLLIVTPFLIWTIILYKNIVEPITKKQKIQFYILTFFPIIFLMFIDIWLLGALVKLYFE